MQLKLKLTVVAAIAAVAGVASAQEQVVKIGHVAPVPGAQAHYGKDNENGARMAIEELNAQGVTIGGKKIKVDAPKTTVAAIKALKATPKPRAAKPKAEEAPAKTVIKRIKKAAE